MSKYKTAIRAVLKKFPDGLNAAEIQRFIEAKHSTSVITALKDMGEAYIDRWEKRATGQLAAVWCLADVPEHCPRPDYSPAHQKRLTKVNYERTYNKSNTEHCSC